MDGNITKHHYPLADFFRGAFDGSGADNFYDAGSCIDGRLTSAWNCKIMRFTSLPFLLQNTIIAPNNDSSLGCSQIERKSYFPVFLLTVCYFSKGERKRNEVNEFIHMFPFFIV